MNIPILRDLRSKDDALTVVEKWPSWYVNGGWRSGEKPSQTAPDDEAIRRLLDPGHPLISSVRDTVTVSVSRAALDRIRMRSSRYDPSPDIFLLDWNASGVDHETLADGSLRKRLRGARWTANVETLDDLASVMAALPSTAKVVKRDDGGLAIILECSEDCCDCDA